MTGLFLCAVFLPVQLAVTQKSQSAAQNNSRNKTHTRSPELQNLLSQARTLPAEFAIDTFLRVASSKSLDKEWKQEILEEAFTLTPGLQNKLREEIIPFHGISADTRPGYRSSSFALKLDALSAQSRIVELMLPLDKTRSVQMLD